MHECKAMQLLETEEKNTKTKKQRTMVTKGKTNEVQGPSQKDSVRLSLLHPKPFRCTKSIGVCIHIRVIFNSKI